MHRLLRRLATLGASLGTLAVLAHCAGEDITLPDETGPAAISKLEGDNQFGSAGAPLNDSLGVKVVNRRGEAVANQRVAFALEGNAPGAAITPEVARTGSDGMARARWVLGAISGTQAVVARVVGADGLAVRFEAAVGSSDPESIAEAGGNNQSGAVGTALAGPLAVLVTDHFGNPVANVRVNWEAGDGSVDPSSSSTGVDGRASTSWVLGSSTGSQTATASSDGLNGSPVTFSATAAAGSADHLVRVSGNNQSGQPGQELAEPLVVRLVDKNGNGIADRAVSWVIAAGGGTVPSFSGTTDGNGEARTRWTLGPDPVTNTLTAVVSGVDVVGFTATATSGGGGGGGSSPSRLEFLVQPSDAQRDKRISPPVQVELLDRDGNRVTDEVVEIKLELRGDDGKLRGDSDHRTQSGVATFDDLKVDREGDYRLRASADGLPSVDSDQFRVRGD